MPLTGREKRKNNFDMEQVKLTCQVCENHCALEAEVEDGEVMDVMGNRCLKGFSYAQRAVTGLWKKNDNFCRCFLCVIFYI